MENNNTMEIVETETMEDVIVANEGSGIGTVAAIAIGAGLACAVGAAFKWVPKLVAWCKAKKELKQPETEIEVTDEDLEEVVTK